MTEAVELEVTILVLVQFGLIMENLRGAPLECSCKGIRKEGRRYRWRGNNKILERERKSVGETGKDSIE